MKKISFLASHGGSAARTIIQAIESKTIHAAVGIVITNNRDSVIYDWCVQNNITVHHISGKTHPDEVEKDKTIHALLSEAKADLVVLSGYMKKIGPITLTAFENRMMNIHPSLLPKHGGHGLYSDSVHESVLKSGDAESGATVHLINAEYDEGPMLLQHRVPVLANDTVQTLKARVQAIEGKLYVDAIKRLLTAPTIDQV